MYLKIENDSNKWLSAIVLATLLPVIDNDELFECRYEQLFGRSRAAKILSLNRALEQYSSENRSIALLNKQINQVLRPRLAQHLTDNSEDLSGFFASDDALETERTRISSNESISNYSALLNILSLWLAATIKVYNHSEQMACTEYSAIESTECVVSLVSLLGQVHPLIDSEQLSPARAQKLTPCLTTIEPAETPEVSRDNLIKRLHERHFNHLIKSTLSANSNHLPAIHGIYAMHLLPAKGLFSPTQVTKNTVFLRPSDNKLEYWLKNEAGLSKNGYFTSKQLSHSITEAFNAVDLGQCKQIILNTLTRKKIIPHSVAEPPMSYLDPRTTPYLTATEGRQLRLNAIPEALNAQLLLSSDRIKLLPSQSIGNGHEWLISMVKSTGVSALVSTAQFDFYSLVSLVTAGSVNLSFIALASLPFFVGSMVATLGLSAAGKLFAVQFEESLRLAKTHLDSGDYVRGMQCLDAEFSRWFGVRTIRHAFLTKEHYALAHFFRGTCTLYNGEQINFNKAYDEFKAAASDAKSANNLSLLLVAQLQRIMLLKDGAVGEDFEERPASAVITEILTDLTELIPNAFADLYWKFNDKIAKLSQKLQGPLPLSMDDSATINQYLIADGMFILRDYGRGRGQFMEAFFSFFQSTVLAAMTQAEDRCLSDEAITILRKQLYHSFDDERDSPLPPKLSLSIKKLKQCGQLLNDFIQQHPELAANSQIQLCMSSIKSFAKGLFFHMRQHSGNNLEYMMSEITTTGQLLGIKRDEIIKYVKDTNVSIAYLADLSLDFQQTPYDTIDKFLNELTTPGSALINRVSPSTGDTLLHRLVALTASQASTPKMREAARCLSSFAYIRNNKGQTPIYLLKTLGDPHGLLAIINAHSMIQLGDELRQVDSFLAKINQNPAIDGHFLLLEGPAGTGKTSSVQRHLTQLGYSVQSWSRGEERDTYVGGLPTRIKKFFSDAKSNAARTKRTQILFIDEIDQITPLSMGGAIDPKHHSRDQDTATFQTEITDLNGHKVILIGATNYPTRIAKPMLSRAGTNRIHFALPDESQRVTLLNFIFRERIISMQHIERLAKIAVAYSPRELQSFADSIEATSISEELMIDSFNRYARTLTKEFKDEFQYAELFMPSFQQAGDLSAIFSSNASLADQMERLKSEVFIEDNKHTLLYGPPGSGKTTAVRMLAQNSGRILIAIQADENISKDELTKIFDRAKQLAPSIIFFDEIDNLARQGTRHGAFIQTEMDGITQNDITIIGATNYPTRIERAILSRFTSKIELPQLDAIALAQPIKTSLMNKITLYGAPVYVDPALHQELNDSPEQLSQECDGLSLRHISAAFGYLLGDLKRENPIAGITYLRLQDVLFSIFAIKVQEGLIERAVDNNLTQRAYIKQNRNLFFPEVVPTDSLDFLVSGTPQLD